MSTEVEFNKIDQAESWDVFDAAAHRLLNLSADEFVQRWERGEYATDDDIKVMQVVMLRPSGG